MTKHMKALLFRADTIQLCQLMANAVNASVNAAGKVPKCLAALQSCQLTTNTVDALAKATCEMPKQHITKVYTIVDMLTLIKPNSGDIAGYPIVNLDYVDTRMCHLLIYENERIDAVSSRFEMILDFDPEYQSFAKVYPDAITLVKSVGIDDYEIKD